eukprot:1526666-Rhodomonas_salina.1
MSVPGSSPGKFAACDIGQYKEEVAPYAFALGCPVLTLAMPLPARSWGVYRVPRLVNYAATRSLSMPAIRSVNDTITSIPVLMPRCRAALSTTEHPASTARTDCLAVPGQSTRRVVLYTPKSNIRERIPGFGFGEVQQRRKHLGFVSEVAN